MTKSIFGQVVQKHNPTDFLPKGYLVFEEIYGDLNKDGIEDCVLIIKEDNKDNIVTYDSDEKVDNNRRGILILFKNKNLYQLVLKNYDCFPPEHDPFNSSPSFELQVSIKNGNLSAYYDDGANGYRKYTFRFQNSDFELIGFDSSFNSELNYLILDYVSINFLSKKKLLTTLMSVNHKGEFIYDETWKKIKISGLVKLSEIKDFDELDLKIVEEK